jgi:hypothetical protein
MLCAKRVLMGIEEVGTPGVIVLESGSLREAMKGAGRALIES